MKNYEYIARLIGMTLAVFGIALYFGISGVEEPIREVEVPKLVSTHTTKAELEEVLDSLGTMVVEAEAEDEPEVMLNIEDYIVQEAQRHGIPWEIPLAIARLETGWFTSSAYLNKNNPGGLSRNEVPISFDTIEEGVEAFISNLARNYYVIGLDTPEEIGKKYCPVNPEWPSLVRQLMEYEYMGG